MIIYLLIVLPISWITYLSLSLLCLKYKSLSSLLRTSGTTSNYTSLNEEPNIQCPTIYINKINKIQIFLNTILLLYTLIQFIYIQFEIEEKENIKGKLLNQLISGVISIYYFLNFQLIINYHYQSLKLKLNFIIVLRSLLISSLILLVSLLIQFHKITIVYSIIFISQLLLSFFTTCYEIYLYTIIKLSWDERERESEENTNCECNFYLKNKRKKNAIEEELSTNQFKGIQHFNRKVRQILPFLWPKDSIKLKILIIISIILMLAGRLVNFLMPRQYSLVIKALSSEDKPLTENIPYMEIGIFVLLRSLQGSIGLLNNVQTFVWIPVSQYTTRELSVSMLQHLHNLSIRFHLNRKTGEILRVQDRGVASVVSVLNAVLFNIIPTLIDIGVAIIVFVTKFDIYIGGVVFLTTSLYIILTVKLTDWRTKYRRRCNKLDNEMEARAVDSLLNFETIKYFGNEEFEVNQYAKSIDKYQNADLETKVVSSILNTLQNIIIQIGLLVGCLIGAYRIINKQINLNEFIWIIAYIDQLYGPLNWFGGYYRTIQKNFIDMENMLDLFKVPIEINDNLNVKEFNIIKGEIEFKNVSFHYDSRLSILKNISFKVPSGSTVALVGPSGGGKSTILRLLFRFYDINSGQILIDNKDIRDMKQKDLRKSIGVVPQDSVLFNEDLYYNILYGKINSTKQEIEIAAKAAQIHERILSFPDQYHTKVGERGLRLSGGEKQRIAIARTFLRDPKIVLLDEATSALDTTTERQIQSSLKSITKGRTTLIIAHRLSTIIEADIILVLNQGEIIERGSHNELMNNPNGMYYDMWMKQLYDETINNNNNNINNNNINNNNINNNNNKFNNKSQVKNIKRECEFNEDSDNYDPSIDSNPLLPFSTSCPAYF